MTTTVIVSVYDTIANLYGSPFVAINRATAMRSFHGEQAVRPERGPMQSHPEDFALYQLGTFDDSTGTISLLNPPEFLCRGTLTESA